MTTTPAVLVCLPTDQHPDPPIPGSVTMRCVRCSQPVLVAPTGQGVLQSGEATGPLCTGCAPSEAFDAETVARSLDRPGVLGEIRTELKRRESSR